MQIGLLMSTFVRFGAAIVVLFVLVLNNQRYLGLSLPLLEDAFAGNAQPFDFVGKLFFTVLSLGAGFQGGEVTPLFEIGATLGVLWPLCYIYQFLFSRFRIYWCFFWRHEYADCLFHYGN